MRIKLVRPAEAPRWFLAWMTGLEVAINRALNAQTPRPRPKYAIAELPAADEHAGSDVFITDTSRPAYSDGTAWRYTSDEALV